MNGTQQYGPHGAQSFDDQLTPQGLLGSLLGGFAGGVIGKAVGGSTGQTFGGVAGKLLGGLLPLDAGQPAAGDQPPSQLEMQGFWDVVRKVTGGLRTGLDIGRQLGILSAGQAGPQQQISEIEAQCFSRVIDWLARSAPQTMQAQRPTAPTAGIAPFSAGQPGAGEQSLSQVELQGFWDVLRKVAGGVRTGLNVGHRVGLFEAGQPGAGEQSLSQVELQGFWDVLRKVAGGVRTGLNVGHRVGLFEAGQPGAGEQSLSQVELQGFWDVLRKVAGGVRTGLDIGHRVGLFEAGQGSGPQSAMQGDMPPPEQIQALLQQALPALQAMAQQGYTRH
ncbi:MAG: hypothetical protein PGN34_25265 [Methylobacterium frigidaeris]